MENQVKSRAARKRRRGGGKANGGNGGISTGTEEEEMLSLERELFGASASAASTLRETDGERWEEDRNGGVKEATPSAAVRERGVYDSLVEVLDSETQRLDDGDNDSEGTEGSERNEIKRDISDGVGYNYDGRSNKMDLILTEDRTGDRTVFDRGRYGNDDEEDCNNNSHDDEDKDHRKAVWIDEDDKRLVVDIADGVGRRRKLRRSLNDRIVSGSEYEQRLREQHATMHPRTDWANVRDVDDIDEEISVNVTGRTALDRNRSQAQLRPDNNAHKIAAQYFKSGSAALASTVDELAHDKISASTLGLDHSEQILLKDRLPPGHVRVTRLRDANIAQPSNAVVQSLDFHPTVQGLMFTAGFDKKLRYFQVDGKKNPFVQGVHFDDMPIHKASFVGRGNAVLCAGRRKFMYLHHLESSKIERIAGISGREEKSFESFAINKVHGTEPVATESLPLVAFLGAKGCVPLLSLRSRQAAGTLRMSGTVRCASFCNDGANLLTAGGDGAICLWDLRMMRCLDKVQDHGTLNCTALDCSGKIRSATTNNVSFYACGSDAGIVNVYQTPKHGMKETSPFLLSKKPEKTLMNLTTSIDNIVFSSDCQMMAISSRLKKEAMRLVHLPSCTVFSNWPTRNTPLHYVHSLAFSTTNELLAVGNARGKVLLYRVLHYATADDL